MSDVPFPDNTPCLKMIIAQGGVMALLDEECQLGSGTDKAFYDKVAGKFAGHDFFEVKKTSRSAFIIKHYAGDVSYETEGFRDKNLDTLKDAWKLILRASTDPFMAALLPAPVETKGPKITVGGFFRSQLSQLMELINSTTPHWIRCIKPHPAKKPLMFDGISVMNQLSSSGVLGTVKIRKAGYAVRIPLALFEGTYKIIAKAAGKSPDIPGIFAACGYQKAEAQVGKKRVFLRSHIYMDIEIRKKNALTGSSKIVQAFAKGAKAYLQTNNQVKLANKTLIDKLRKAAHTLVQLQITEQKQRTDQQAREINAMRQLQMQMNASKESAREAEMERRRAVLEAIADLNAKQQNEIAEEEETFREVMLQEWDTGIQVYLMRAQENYQVALELTARREHKEAESILMAERREIREGRRKRELERILDQSAGRLQPTLVREDRTMHALQRQVKAKESKIETIQQRAVEEEKRRQRVEVRQEHRHKESEKKIQETQTQRWKTAQQMAKSKIAFERYERVMREDFEWQRMEQQILRGQQLSLEEQRRVFLQEKSEQDKARRAKLKEDEIKFRDQKFKEFQEEKERRESDQKKREENKAKEERKIFNALTQFRDEVRRREKARKVEKSIAWDNDRRERMILQRPDIDTEEILNLPLAERVEAPPPFVMVNNQPTYSKLWTPFRVMKLTVAPSTGVAIGGPFTVSWLATRPTQHAYISINSGSGEIQRKKVKTALGEHKFYAPDEWFSELEIYFVLGVSDVQMSAILPKATS